MVFYFDRKIFFSWNQNPKNFLGEGLKHNIFFRENENQKIFFYRFPESEKQKIKKKFIYRVFISDGKLF